MIDDEVISTLVQLEYSGFDGATVPICAFTLSNGHIRDYKGCYVRLSEFKGSDIQGPKTLEAIQDRSCGWFFEVRPDFFKKIPGSPIAYWVGDNVRGLYERCFMASDRSTAVVGLQTGDNDKFMRFWHEVNISKLSRSFRSCLETKKSNTKWVPYNKGGSYRKWYGNQEHVVNWKDDGFEIRNFKDASGKLRSRPQNSDYYFREGVTWSEITSSWKSFRFNPPGSISDVKGQSAYFKNDEELFSALAWLNSNVVELLTKVQNPTLSFQSGDYKRLPIPEASESLAASAKEAISISKEDWNNFEVSMDFSAHPLLGGKDIIDGYSYYLRKCESLYDRLVSIECGLNDKFIKEFELFCDVDGSVSSEQITLMANKFYRYGSGVVDSVLCDRFSSDTLCEFLSYAIGCIMGRYSLDREGLVYAHAGNQGFAELVAEGAYKTFPADSDGILPLNDQEWFADDATNRFREFVRTVWGDEHLQENLDFVAESLCLYAIKPKRGESALDTIRRYLSTQFFKDHLKAYKKRPIYWLFSSGKHKAFECLVYLHRYNEGTLARMRTEYVIPLTAKLNTYANKLEQDIDASTSTAEKKRLEKELATLHNQQAELATFDEKLRHYADQRISLDLDDGVKVNYGKFGDLLAEVKTVTGDKASD